MTESQQLLADYAENGSEPAFRELVARYVNLVYSTALRLVNGDAHLAEDVTQTVFVRLSRKAGSLAREIMLGGWLHRDACFVASKTMRRERRRQARERQAAFMQTQTDHSAANLEKVAPRLDDAINRLGNADRTAILLRFFEQHDFRSVGVALGTNEDAARMRVTRAVEKLHSILTRRGVNLSAAALGTVLASEAVTSAPVGLALSISSTALASGATGSGAALAFFKMMTMTKLKSGIIGALLVAGVATPVVLQQQGTLREKDVAWQQHADQLDRLTAENQRLSNLAAQVKSVFTDDQLRELMRLRGEVGLLRRQTNELGKLAEENRRFRAALPNSRPNSPNAEEDPAGELEKQFGIAKLTDAKELVLGFIMHADKNQNRFPANSDQLAPYLRKANLTGTNDFEIVYQGSSQELANPNSVILVREQQAWRTRDGKWAKTYGFADGHSEIHSEPEGNFEAWEKKHIVPVVTAKQ